MNRWLGLALAVVVLTSCGISAPDPPEADRSIAVFETRVFIRR